MSDGTGKLLVIDGHAYAYRAFFAIRSLNAPDGKPTNAIYGFVKMMAGLVNWLNPSHVVVAWDGGLAESRVQAHPEYKANRPEMPADLGNQIDGIVEHLGASGCASVCESGVEADDWIGTIATHAVAAGMPVVVASSDKDFMQLVGPLVSLANPGDKPPKLWSKDDVMAKTGVRPDQIVDWLSLVGDAVDNIPGVPGVGPKTASSLLNEFGSVRGIYERLAEVKSDRIRQALQAARLDVSRNQDLVSLNIGLPGDYQMERFRLGQKNCERLGELYRGWGFRGLLEQLEREMPAQRELL